jgi:hypothetical protein
MQEAALVWARVGLPVFPLFEVIEGRCACRRPDCDGAGRGKHPRVLRGLKAATLDETTIRKWWSWWPESNIGIRTGSPSIVAIDLDTASAAAALLERVDGHDLGGLLTATGRGYQLWYLAPDADDVPNATTFGGVDGLDVRGRGGYVVAPPSLHYSGAEYRIVQGELAPLPVFLYAQLRARPRAAASQAVARTPCEGEGTLFGLAALRRECAELRATAEGSRNRKLNLVAYLAGRLVAGGELSEAFAAAEIERAAREAGLESTEISGRDGQGGTLWSGLRAGRRSPLTAETAPLGMPETQPRNLHGKARGKARV